MPRTAAFQGAALTAAEQLHSAVLLIAHITADLANGAARPRRMRRWPGRGRLGTLSEGLQQLNAIQRKWVYLEPIFSRGALPEQQARFRRVSPAKAGRPYGSMVYTHPCALHAII